MTKTKMANEIIKGDIINGTNENYEVIREPRSARNGHLIWIYTRELGNRPYQATTKLCVNN
jgi:hypothetical protein